MKFFAVFNRDGGTFRTTDMDADCGRAATAFREAGHEVECHIVAGDEVVATMRRAAETPGVEGLIAGGGDGTISAAADIAWRSGLTLAIVAAGTMKLVRSCHKLPLAIWWVLDVCAA